jgi:hypothetical protein
LCHGALPGDDHQIWCNFLKWYENEGSLGETGVRNVEVGFVENQGSEQQDIEVEGAGAVGNAGGAVAAKLALDAKKGGEEGGGREVRFESDDGVDEAWLVGESDGRGGIEGRPADDLADGSESLGGGGESGFRRTGGAGDVGAHSDVSGLHKFKGSAERGKGLRD